jgi:drug/metabolite transporter (DMT)-like permease
MACSGFTSCVHRAAPCACGRGNLVNYLWPLFIVVLAPMIHRARAGVSCTWPLRRGLRRAVSRSSQRDLAGGFSWGYVAALASALIWSSYSLLTKRVPHFPTAAIGLFGLVSGSLALVCHWLLEPAADISARDAMLIAVTGLGPLGAAFFLWDAALKRGDPSTIGILSYLTPLASTLLLIVTSNRQLTGWIAARATVLPVGAAIVGMRAR